MTTSCVNYVVELVCCYGTTLSGKFYEKVEFLIIMSDILALISMNIKKFWTILFNFV